MLLINHKILTILYVLCICLIASCEFKFEEPYTFGAELEMELPVIEYYLTYGQEQKVLLSRSSDYNVVELPKFIWNAKVVLSHEEFEDTLINVYKVKENQFSYNYWSARILTETPETSPVYELTVYDSLGNLLIHGKTEMPSFVPIKSFQAGLEEFNLKFDDLEGKGDYYQAILFHYPDTSYKAVESPFSSTTQLISDEGLKDTEVSLIFPYKYKRAHTLHTEVYLYHITEAYFKYLKDIEANGNGLAVSGSVGKNISEMLSVGRGVFTAFQVDADTLYLNSPRK